MNLNALIAAGFKPVVFDDLNGQGYAKEQKVETLPYANEHIVDGEYVFEGMIAITEILPDGRVQLRIPSATYHEIASDDAEGFDLLKDAGVDIPDTLGKNDTLVGLLRAGGAIAPAPTPKRKP